MSLNVAKCGELTDKCAVCANGDSIPGSFSHGLLFRHGVWHPGEWRCPCVCLLCLSLIAGDGGGLTGNARLNNNW